MKFSTTVTLPKSLNTLNFHYSGGLTNQNNEQRTVEVAKTKPRFDNNIQSLIEIYQRDKDRFLFNQIYCRSAKLHVQMQF